MPDNPVIRIFVSKIEKRITFKIKTGYYLELFKFKMMELLENSQNKITEIENGENMPHLEITVVV